MNKYRIITRDDILEFEALDVINAVMIVIKSKGYLLENIQAVMQIN